MPDRCVSLVVPVQDEDPGVVRKLVRELEVYHSPGFLRELIVVDDGSREPCPYADIRHETPLGYGAALKSGILKAKGELILTLDGDGHHSVWDAQRLLDFYLRFPELDMGVGDRRLQEANTTRYWGRKGLNWIASLFALRWIGDLNSGMRLFRRDVALSYLPILCDQFSFTTSITMAFLADGRPVDWLPIKVAPRPMGASKVQVWRDGWRTLKLIVWIG